MPSLRGFLPALVLAATALLASSGGAVASWHVSGTGSGTVATADLSAPTAVSASVQDANLRTVHVAWTGSPASNGSVPTGYYVQRTSGSTTSAACGTSASALLAGIAVTCNDNAVPVGTYDYTVTAVFRTWTASATTHGVRVATLSAFLVEPSTLAPTAGSTTTVTIKALDETGALNPAYAGERCLSFQGPGSSVTGVAPVYPAAGSCVAGSAITFTGGIGSAFVTLYRAETTNFLVTDTITGTFGQSASLVVAPAAAVKLIFTQQPSASAVAGFVLALQPKVAVADTYSNTVTTAPATAITLAVTGAGFSCTANPVTTSAGVASFAGCFATTAGSGYTITATGGYTSATSHAFAITAGAASKLVFTQQPSASTAAGTVFAQQPKVAVADSYGNTVTGVPATAITLAVTGAGFSCTANPVATASGLASFSGCKATIAAAGYTITATGTYTAATSSAFTITPGIASVLTVASGSPQSAMADSSFASPLVAKVADASGNPISGVTVTFTAPASGATATLAGAATAATTTNASGLATSPTPVAGTVTGAYSVTASVTGLASATFALTNMSATKLVFTTQPSTSTAAGTAFAAQPKVAIQNASNVTVTTASARITLTVTGAGFSCTTNPVTTVSGVATFAGCKGTIAGTGYTITATATGITTGTSTAFSITPGSAAKLLFTQQPSASSVAGSVFAQQPKVAVTDAYYNTVTTASSTITIAASGSGLTCTATTLSTALGVSSFAGCKATVAGSYTLTATASGRTSATSSSFAIVAGAASALTVSSGSSQTAVVAASFASPLVAKVADAGGNGISGVTVTFTAPASGATATLSGAATVTATTNASGLATSPTPLASTTTGAYSVTASVTGLASATFALTNSAGTAVKLAFTQHPSGATVGFAFATQAKVAVQDSYGNTVTSVVAGSVSLAITTGTGTSGATLSTCSAVNTSSGVATFSGCKIGTAGTGYTLTATRTGYTDAISLPFAVTPALVPSSLTLVNKTGGTAGTAETGDAMVITFNTTVKARTICAAWTSDTAAALVTDGVVVVTNNSSSDTITFTSASCTGSLHIGTVTVGAWIANSSAATSYTASTVAWDPTTRTLTITFGTSAKSITSATSFTPSFTPSTSITDPNGRAISGTVSAASGLAF